MTRGCIPGRAAALILSALQALLMLAAAGLLWYRLAYFTRDPAFTAPLRGVTGTVAGFYTLIGFFSVWGFVGIWLERVVWVASFAMMSIWLVGLQIGGTILFVAIYFSIDHDKLIRECTNGSIDDSVITRCKDTYSANEASTILSFVTPIVFAACCARIFSVYAIALSTEYKAKRNSKTTGNVRYSTLGDDVDD